MSIFRALEKQLDQAHDFIKNHKHLKKVYRAHEANDTFVRTPKKITKSRVHVRDGVDTKRVMVTVIIALLPCLLWAMYNAGYQKLTSLAAPNDFVGNIIGIDPGFATNMLHGAWAVLPMVAVTYFVGLNIEMLFASIRDEEVNEGFLVSGMLIPLSLPPDMPLWMIAVGTAFGVIVGKEMFGGTGMNFLNPALTARAFLFFSYPGAISGDAVWRAVDATKDSLINGYTGATPLLAASSVPRGGDVVAALDKLDFTFANMFFGLIPGSVGEVSTFTCILGAVILLVTGVGSWRVMLSVLLGGSFMGLVFNMFGSETSLAIFNMPFYYHIVMGGFAFGLVFMATDPVSASSTNTGKWIYGAMIGILAVLIRVINPAYPEGMMLAILFMNVFAPLIDNLVVEKNIKRRVKRWELANVG